MTLKLVDIASWQTTDRRPSDPLNLAKAKEAGFTLVNIKSSQGNWYGYRSWMKSYADKARQLNMGISTFHWLDNSASGSAQANIAYQRMKDIGGPDGMAHQCDCEDSQKPATFTIWKDYVKAMQDKLGRPIINYTGDWWWKSRNWLGASVTPYLWAAPNSGYLTNYPGDTSTAWHAGYGGWKDYSILQYAVSEISGAGGGKISKSAIRDHAIWKTLTGEDDDMTPEELRDRDIWPNGYGDRATNPTIAFGTFVKNVAAETDKTMRDVAELKTAIADLAARPPVEISDDQLERVLRRVLGMAPQG